MDCIDFFENELTLSFEEIFWIMMDKVLIGEIKCPNGRRVKRVTAFIFEKEEK